LEPSINGLIALKNIEPEDVVKIALKKYNAGMFNDVKRENS
jgi:hypothetical protein